MFSASTAAHCVPTGFISGASTASDDVNRVHLFVREIPLTVNGKTVMMGSVVQADGTQGYSPNQFRRIPC